MIVELSNNQEICYQVEVYSILGIEMHVMIRADEIKGGIANNEILRKLIKFVHQGWPERVANELKSNFNVRNKLVCM